MQFWAAFPSWKKLNFNFPVKAHLMQPNLHLLWQIPSGIHGLSWPVEGSQSFCISQTANWPVEGSKFVPALAHSHQNSYAKNHEKLQRQNLGSTLRNHFSTHHTRPLPLRCRSMTPRKETPKRKKENQGERNNHMGAFYSTAQVYRGS